MPVLACTDISLLNLALSFSRDFKQMNHAWLPLKGEGDDLLDVRGGYFQSLE